MDRDSARIDIDDHEIWEQRRARLKVLESVNTTHLQAELKHRVYLELSSAALGGNVDEFIEALEEYSVKERVSLSDIIGIQGPSGNSLLHVAAGIEKADILQALLEVICDQQLATKVNYQGDTALHLAARAGRICTAKLLLGYGSIVDMVNDMGNTALHEAVKNRHYELTHLLLSRQGSKSVYLKNKENKCPLYLAVEMGDSKNLLPLMDAVGGYEVLRSQMEGMPPVHGAVIHQKIDMLKEMSKWKKDLFDLQDAGGGTPLHVAALMNYVDGVKFLVRNFAWSTYVGDQEGYFPIHVACKMGHHETINELLSVSWQDPKDWLTLKEGHNILHVAAKYGMTEVVDSILANPRFKELINAKDKEGNTAVHVATLQLQSVVLMSLIFEDEVNLQLVNNDNLTALDIADEQRKKIDGLQENFIYAILVFAGAPRSFYKAICQPKDLDPAIALEPRHLDRLKDVANTRMLVATLIAAMTFAAGFSVPGGYNGSGPDAGFATLLNKPMFDIFVICNTVALYVSLIAVAILHWTDRVGPKRMAHVLRIARELVVIAFVAMSVAFLAGVYVTISKRIWIAVVALIVGITALLVILSHHIVFNPVIMLKVMRFFIWISRSNYRRRLTRRAAAA